MAKIIKTIHRIKHGPKKDDYHDPGTELEVGADADINAEDAAALLKSGAASEVATAKTKAPAAKKDVPVTLETFAAAVGILSDKDADKDVEGTFFTASGSPDCGALADVGCKVTAAERDEFWAKM